jgi:hypothetical protein
MVSSFHIKTTIRVGPKARDAFNAWVDEHGTSETKMPAYFDQGFCDDTIDPADIDPAKDKESPSRNSWFIKANGVLVDCCEKFHGAITALHWCIQEFFAPRGIKLNGTVVGMNTEYGVLYIYNVRNNVIEIDMENTRKYLAEYREMWARHDEMDDDEKGDDCPWEGMMDQIVYDLDLPAEGYF